MEIKLNNLTLADNNEAKVNRIELNGQHLIQSAQLFRAAYAGIFARGNRALTLAFEITRAFNTVTATETEALTHINALPELGDLVMTTGDAHETRIICEMKDAALESVQTQNHETALRLRYVFKGKEIVSTGQVDPIDGGGYDGGNYGTPVQGSIDGGNYADALIPASLDIDGGLYS